MTESIEEKIKDICEWTADCGDYETSCNNCFCFEIEGPTGNGFKFCPYCGKNLIEITEDE